MKHNPLIKYILKTLNKLLVKGMLFVWSESGQYIISFNSVFVKYIFMVVRDGVPYVISTYK